MLIAIAVSHMKHTLTATLGLAPCLWTAAVLSQPGRLPATPQANSQSGGLAAAGVSAQSEPVSYASVSELNALLEPLEAASERTQADLVKLRIERWKTDNATKRQALANVDSIQRNLEGALPEIISALRAGPEDLTPTFRLYRNLDALYDVFGSVVELAGAFGPKQDLPRLSEDLSNFEAARKQLAERLANLSQAKEAEIVRLRTELKTAQASIPVTPPKKMIVDDNEPPKKPVAKKKTSAKPTTATKRAPGPAPNPPPQEGSPK